MSDDLTEITDRRAHPRYNISGEGRLALNNGTVYEGEITCVSFGGVFLQFVDPPASHNNEAGLIFLTTYLGKDVVEFSAACEIARCDPCGLGIRFVDVADKSREILDRILNSSKVSD